MDNKLGTLFSIYREKNKQEENLLDLNTEPKSNPSDFKREIPFTYEGSTISTNNNGKKNGKEQRLKELNEKLTETEKKIKIIAGTILKNF